MNFDTLINLRIIPKFKPLENCEFNYLIINLTLITRINYRSSQKLKLFRKCEFIHLTIFLTIREVDCILNLISTQHLKWHFIFAASGSAEFFSGNLQTISYFDFRHWRRQPRIFILLIFLEKVDLGLFMCIYTESKKAHFGVWQCVSDSKNSHIILEQTDGNHLWIIYENRWI